MILFLDDEEWRWREFSSVWPDATWVRTADQAKAALNHDWALISLDHDLGAVCGNGMQVVEHMVAQGRRRARVVVHSWNGPAADRMVAKLRQSGICGELGRMVFGPEYVAWLRSVKVSACC